MLLANSIARSCTPFCSAGKTSCQGADADAVFLNLHFLNLILTAPGKHATIPVRTSGLMSAWCRIISVAAGAHESFLYGGSTVSGHYCISNKVIKSKHSPQAARNLFCASIDLGMYQQHKIGSSGQSAHTSVSPRCTLSSVTDLLLALQ